MTPFVAADASMIGALNRCQTDRFPDRVLKSN